MAVKEITTEEFDEFVGSGNSVVDFWAPWCGPCKMMGPQFEKASEEMKDVKFAKVNVDENSELAGRFAVLSIPTVIFFKDKEQVDRFSGAMSATDIAERIEKNF